MKKKLFITFGIIVILLVVYFCLPEKKCATPQTATTLNLDQPVLKKDFEYISEDNYLDTMFNDVCPYLESIMIDNYFEGYDGNLIHYRNYLKEDSRAHIVIVHGYTDFADKFDELIYYFLNANYSVSILEHRGHGYSYRELSDLSKVTINGFDEYIKDLEIFVDDIVTPLLKEDEQLFTFAHSMGGAIATLYMIEHPDIFDCAILSSPMMEVEYGGIPKNVVSFIVNFSINFGMKNNYILGNGPYDDTYNFDPTSNRSEARYQYMYELSLNNYNYQTFAGTYAWLDSAINATKDIASNADKYCVDTLLFQAEDDTTVGPNGQNYFVKNADNVSMVIVPNTMHSIFYAKDDIVHPYMDTILSFYNSHIN